jgi:hypothetical protein
MEHVGHLSRGPHCFPTPFVAIPTAWLQLMVSEVAGNQGIHNVENQRPGLCSLNACDEATYAWAVVVGVLLSCFVCGIAR